MTLLPPIPKEYQRLIFGALAVVASMISLFVAVTVPSASALAGDMAKIFGVGFVSALSFYFGSRGHL